MNERLIGTALVSFDFDGSDVHVVTRDGEPWFVLADVRKVLGVGNPSQAASRLDDDERSTLISSEGRAGSGPQSYTIINEAGLYRAILQRRSTKGMDDGVKTTLDSTEGRTTANAGALS